MQSTRRWFAVSLAIALLMGAAWYGLHFSAPAKRAVDSLASTKAAERPVAVASNRAVLGRTNTKAAGESAKDGVRATVVCGVGTVQLDSNDRAAPFNYVRRLTGSAQSRWQRTLINSDDLHVRAAGLLLQSRGWQYDSVTGMPTRTHDAELARDELVQLAAGLDDLPVYAMAVRACDQSDEGAPSAACDRISRAKWAAMDADNAAPWLDLAVAAHARSDREAEFAAVSHATQAHRVDFYNDSLLAYASSNVPAEATGLERAAFFDGLIGHVGGDGHALGFVRAYYCTAEAVKQSSIRQQCEAVAELLANHGRNTLEWDTAAGIGARLGWEPERIIAMRQETLAMFRVETYSGKDPWSCDNVRALNEFAAIQGQSGELAAARDAIQKSGKSIAELAQEQIEFLGRE